MNAHRLAGLGLVSILVLAAPGVAADVQLTTFQRTDLVSDALPAVTHDPNLVNSWGIVTLSNGQFWTANNGTDTATVYRPDGQQIPSAANPKIVSVPGAPTGVALNTTGSFVVSEDGRAAPSTLLFATESGTILGYNDFVDPHKAIEAVDFGIFDSVFKGLAVLQTQAGPRLYAADFANGLVLVFGGTFHLANVFTDPFPHDDFAPFNVAAIGGSVFVAFAKQAPNSTDEEDGPGLGFIDQFTPEGFLVRRFATGGALNAPWAMVRAPASFGNLAGDLLVGNFGDGTINAYSFSTGAFLGKLRDCGGNAVTIDGLWGLAFGKTSQTRSSLYFASGPDDEAHGLAGVLTPVL